MFVIARTLVLKNSCFLYFISQIRLPLAALYVIRHIYIYISVSFETLVWDVAISRSENFSIHCKLIANGRES